MGSENYIHLKTKFHSITMKTAGTNRVKMGDKLNLVFDLTRLHFFDPQTEKRIE